MHNITRKLRTRIYSERTTRRKRKTASKCYMPYMICCMYSVCMIEEPMKCLDDIYYKEIADERLAVLEEKFINDILPDDAYRYMMMGYGILIICKYKDASVFFNRALSFI